MIVLKDGSRVAIDWVTDRSHSSAIKAERRLNVQSGLRKGKVKKCCGHLARAQPSMIVGTEMVLAGIGWARWDECVDAPFGWHGGRSRVRLDVGSVWFMSPKIISVFLSVKVDDFKLAGKRQNIDPMWKVLLKEVDLGEPTSFFDHVHLGCSTRIRNEQRYCEKL